MIIIHYIQSDAHTSAQHQWHLRQRQHSCLQVDSGVTHRPYRQHFMVSCMPPVCSLYYLVYVIVVIVYINVTYAYTNFVCQKLNQHSWQTDLYTKVLIKSDFFRFVSCSIYTMNGNNYFYQRYYFEKKVQGALNAFTFLILKAFLLVILFRAV